MSDKEQKSDLVLIAHDGSTTAQNAAHLAIQIAHAQHLRVHGIYVIDPTLTFDTYANYDAELGSAEQPPSHSDLIARFEERGELVLEWLRACCRTERVPVTTNMEFGEVPEMILREAPEAVFLALGRRGHGHAGDSHYLGHYFRTLAHHAPQPLLVGGGEPRPVQRLLLAYDGSLRAQRALVWAARFLHTLPAEVAVLVVQEDSEPLHQWIQEAQACLDEYGMSHSVFLQRRGKPATEILAVAAENKIDLIVMGGYRHTALVEWLVGSTLDRVLRTSSLPVVIA